MHKQLAIIFFVLFIQSTSADELRPLTSLNKLDYELFHSKIIDHKYHIYIKTPEAAEENKTYPTVYLLDGGVTFPLLAAYSRYLELAEDIPEVMVVGISYGTDDWQKGNRRSVDFTAPAQARDFWGGAEQFSKMFQDELIPFIEGNYPSDPKRRILFGQSLGGQFVIYSAMFKPNIFWGHIASNPALHRNLEFFKKPPLINKAERRLYVSRARNDADRFKTPLSDWLTYWSDKPSPYLLETNWLENHNHFSAAPDAYRNGMIWLLNTED